MKQAAWLFAIALTTAGCSNLVHSRSAALPQQADSSGPAPVVTPKESVRQEEPSQTAKGASLAPIATAPSATQPVESNKRPIAIVSNWLRPTPDRQPKEPMVNAVPRAESPKQAAAPSKTVPESATASVARKTPSPEPSVTKKSAPGSPPTTETQKPAAEPAQKTVVTGSTYSVLSTGQWYGAGTICFVIFTSILDPLLVEFIKYQLGLGRRQSSTADVEIGQ
jgi:hypothetical protein